MFLNVAESRRVFFMARLLAGAENCTLRSPRPPRLAGRRGYDCSPTSRLWGVKWGDQHVMPGEDHAKDENREGRASTRCWRRSVPVGIGGDAEPVRRGYDVFKVDRFIEGVGVQAGGAAKALLPAMQHLDIG